MAAYFAKSCRHSCILFLWHSKRSCKEHNHSGCVQNTQLEAELLLTTDALANDAQIGCNFGQAVRHTLAQGSVLQLCFPAHTSSTDFYMPGHASGEGLDYKAMGSIFSGLVQCGAWGCFDEFNRIEAEVLSVVSSQIRQIQEALKNGLTRFPFEGKVHTDLHQHTPTLRYRLNTN